MITRTGASGRAERLGIPFTELTMLLVVVIWGLNFPITKGALDDIPPLAFVALRFALGSVLLWGLLRLREGPAPVPAGSGGRLLWLGIVGNTIYQTCFILGLGLTTAGNSALIIATVPTIVALAGALLGIERLSPRIVLGVALAFAGVALVVLARGLELSAETLVGDGLLLGCAATWAVYTLGVRTLSSELSPLRITALTALTGTPGLLLIGLPDLLRTDWAAVSVGAWGGLLYASLLSLVLAYILWNTSVRQVGGNRTAIFNCVTPLVAALAAWPLLGEQPTALHAAGAGLIIGGVLATRWR
jgi:drug/metabolite transporter (DMT)-like permease